MMNICENSSSWERYVVDRSFSSSHTNKIRQVKIVWSCFLHCVSGEVPMWPLTLKKKTTGGAYVHVSLSEPASSLSPHPLKTWRNESSILHSPTIRTFQLEEIRGCAHVVTVVHSSVGAKPLKINVSFGSSFPSPPCENVRGGNEEQWGFGAFVFKNLPLY